MERMETMERMKKDVDQHALRITPSNPAARPCGTLYQNFGAPKWM